jgi:membrane-associated phospholipid phosphatase
MPRQLYFDAMTHRLNSYSAYSVGAAIVWAVILIVVAAGATTAKLHTFLLVFAGWVIGWASATIARYVYPPPKAQRPRA